MKAKPKKQSATINMEQWMDEVFPDLSQRPEGSFTVEDIMKKTNIARTSANAKLNRMVESGTLTKGKFVKDGRYMNWYIKVEKKK